MELFFFNDMEFLVTFNKKNKLNSLHLSTYNFRLEQGSFERSPPLTSSLFSMVFAVAGWIANLDSKTKLQIPGNGVGARRWQKRRRHMHPTSHPDFVDWQLRFWAYMLKANGLCGNCCSKRGFHHTRMVMVAGDRERREKCTRTIRRIVL